MIDFDTAVCGYYNKIMSFQRKRAVITGIGVLSPIGIGKNDYWRALAEGRSGIKPITLFDTSKLRIKVGGEITGFNAKEILGRVGLVDLDRATRLLSAAAKFALEDARLRLAEALLIVPG